MQQLSLTEQALLAPVDGAPMLAQIERWCAINTGTGNLPGLEHQWGLLADAFAALPGDIRKIEPAPVKAIAPNGTERETPNGAHLVLSVRPQAPRRYLLTGHMDTVFGPAHPFQTLQWLDAETLNGPGVADMKGGIAVILAALRAFEACPVAASVGYDVLINSDEETGSLSSAPLIAELAQEDLFALQETYVGLFDRTRRLSLHLFEHVHGESRDRGQAMVDLAGIYEKGGLVLIANELPDYLPLFLEFLSTRPLTEARGLMADIAHILASLEERLTSRGSAYAAVFAALRTLAADGMVAAPSPAPAVDEPVEDFAALDAAWEETAVTFGPGEGMGACSVDRFRTQLRAAQRDARHTVA